MLCLISLRFYGQNLLDNSSFESGMSQWSTIQSVDFYPDGTSAENFVGPQSAYHGSAFVGVRTFSYYPEWHEYIFQYLDNSLSTGETYKVSFMVNLGECSTSFTDDIGVAFLDQNLPNDYLEVSEIIHSATPQIYNPENNFITDVYGWTAITGYFQATGNEVLIAIGAFKNDDEFSFIPYDNPDYGSEATIYLNIDYVHLSKCIDYPKKDIPDQIICDGELVIIDAFVEGAQYNWSTGDTVSTIEVYSDPGEYSITWQKNGCSYTDNFSVVNFMAAKLPEDTVLCNEMQQPIALNQPAGIHDTFLWDNGSSLSNREVSESGTYWVLKTAGECSSTDSIRISIFEESIQLYPNPLSEGKLHFLDDQDIMEYSLVDCAGKRLAFGSYDLSILEDETRKLASGTYVLILEGSSCKQTVKFVVQN